VQPNQAAVFAMGAFFGNSDFGSWGGGCDCGGGGCC
jgi:hypothetical protein